MIDKNNAAFKALIFMFFVFSMSACDTKDGTHGSKHDNTKGNTQRDNTQEIVPSKVFLQHVALGNDFGCIILENQQVKCWGYPGTKNDAQAQAYNFTQDNKNFISIKSGGRDVIGLKTDGTAEFHSHAINAPVIFGDTENKIRGCIS